MIPIQIGTPEQFILVREFLKEANYTEHAVCQRLGLRALHEFMEREVSNEGHLETIDRLDLVIRLFLKGNYLSTSRLQSCAGREALEAMTALGLLRQDQSDPQRCFSPVALYPAQNLYIGSDRWTNPDGSLGQAFDDIVYPAITGNTQRFLESLPSEPCQSFLELCSGTAAAALMAASAYADYARAVDITERSTQFAEFNRLLNGLANVRVLQGDLYEPVGERTFDRIVAHPPYMPVLKPGLIFYDGGEDGEQVTRRIMAGLARYLRPGGRLYCLTLGTDREGQPFERRLRSWLGEKEGEFDIALVVRKIEDPTEFALRSTLKSGRGAREVAQWKEFFEKRGVSHLVYGSLVIQRKNSSRPAFTARRAVGRRTGRAEIEWLMRWQAAAAEPEIRQRLLSSRPLAAPNLQLQVIHRMQGGDLLPVHFTLQTLHPFNLECKIQPWTSFLVARSDGTTTVQEHFTYCKQNNLIASETPVEEFVDLVRVLVSGGFLEIEGFRPPAAAE